MNRPKITPEIVAKAVRGIAKLYGWGDDAVAQIVEIVRSPIDGYQLAKALDDRFFWDISVSDVEELDNVWDAVRNIHKEACYAWATEYDIQPPYPIGTMTTRGEITGIYKHDAACYEIRETGDTNESRRLIVKFEGVDVCLA